jgi:hypothetical protein
MGVHVLDLVQSFNFSIKLNLELTYLGLAKDDVAVAVGRLIDVRGCHDEKNLPYIEYFFP